MDLAVVGLSALLVLGTIIFLYLNYKLNKKLGSLSSKISKLEVENRTLERSLSSFNKDASQKAFMDQLIRQDEKTRVEADINNLRNSFITRSVFSKAFRKVLLKVEDLSSRLEAVETDLLRRAREEEVTVKQKLPSGVYSLKPEVEERDTLPPPGSYPNIKK